MPHPLLEYQANMAMAALLLPEAKVVQAVLEHVATRAAFPPLENADPLSAELTAALSDDFAVSREMARIRLQVLGFLCAAPRPGA